MKNGYIGVYEFARRTKRDVTALYKLIYTGKLPASKIGKRGVWHIEEKHIEQWAKQD